MFRGQGFDPHGSGGHSAQTPVASKYWLTVSRRRSFTGAWLSRAWTKTSLSRSDRERIWWSSMARRAASCTLVGTKSVTVRPRTAAARSISAFCSAVIRASRRSARRRGRRSSVEALARTGSSEKCAANCQWLQWTRSGRAQQGRNRYVFVQRWPVHALAAADQPPVPTVSVRRIAQSREPLDWGGDAS